MGLVLSTWAIGGCTRPPPRTVDDVAREHLQQLPQQAAPPEREPAEPELRVEPAPFEIFTWQKVPGSPSSMLLLGRNIPTESHLVIGHKRLPLAVSSNGRAATVVLSPDLADNAAMVVASGPAQALVPERFSLQKLRGEDMPGIISARFSWAGSDLPQRFRRAAAQPEKVLRFDCVVVGYAQHDAPTTAFIGSIVVPSDQINDGSESLTGYVMDVSRLQEGDPLTVDFGQGLRVLAPVPYHRPVE